MPLQDTSVDTCDGVADYWGTQINLPRVTQTMCGHEVLNRSSLRIEVLTMAQAVLGTYQYSVPCGSGLLYHPAHCLKES